MHILYSVHRFKHCKYVCKPTECVYVCKYVRPTKTVTCDNGQNALSWARCLDRQSIQFTDQDLVISQRVESIPRRTDWMSAVTCLYLVIAIQLRLCILFLCILIISHLRRCKICMGKRWKKKMAQDCARICLEEWTEMLGIKVDRGTHWHPKIKRAF